MATTISPIHLSLSFSSIHYRKPFFYYHQQQQQPQVFVSYLNSTTTKKKKKHSFVCFACSIKQSRVRKRVKSNEELRSEIMEFVALNQFPQGHVPSMKELSEHGRVDLANIVRRRGYKFIKELLANSDLEDRKELVSETSAEDSLTEGQGEEVDGNLSTAIHFTSIDGSVSLDDVIANSSPEAEECGSLSKDESSLGGVSSVESSLYNMGESNHLGEMRENDLEIVNVELDNRVDIEDLSSEASVSTNLSLVLDDISSCTDIEAANVLKTEDEDVSDVIEDSSFNCAHYTSQNLNYTDIATESLSGLTSENTMENAESSQNQQIDDMADNSSEDLALGVSSSTSSIEEKTTRFMQNGYLDTVDDDENSTPHESSFEEKTKDDEYIGDSYVSQRSLSMPPNGSALALEEVATEVNSSDRNRDQRDGSHDLDKNSHDETMRRENQVEITRLKFMLRQKELELSRLKEQIEKEKLSLSVLQRQAETEIEKAQMLISEKDVELQEAEGSLTGLQEVEIEYCGDGNVVEVTGSFNGWQHRVGMELQPSKSLGKEKWWSTVLWLYPGTYEIKFIVDDQWITDPQKDSVTRGHITNNILKVNI